jgi:enterobacterial common antigen flippase
MQKSEKDSRKSYKRILKSTFIMGGSSVINSLLGIVRTKILALLLGPSGIGLTGIYGSITSAMSSLCGMGIGESGVRQIAAASGTDNEERISRTVLTVRRTALLSGITGLCLLLIFSPYASLLTFGHSGRTFDIALLSAILLFGAISGGQKALIQGMRQIGNLAKMNILSALLGTMISIPIIYFWGERGIVYYLIIVSAMGILTSWWYSRKIKVSTITMNWREIFAEANPLLKLGSAFMLGSLATDFTRYILQVIVVRYLGLEASGMFQAATILSSVYVGVILNAMLTDFYPRLSAVSQDNDKCRSLINEQVEVGLLFAVPGILATLTFAPLIIIIFYTPQFIVAVDVLKWQILGVLLQVVTWPIGFILRAKGDGKLFILTDLFSNCSYLIFSWIGINYFGLSGIGMSFLAMNIAYWMLIYWVARRNYNFSFSTMNIKILTISIIATGIVFSAPYFSKEYHLFINTCITITIALLSLKNLNDMAGTNKLSALWLKIKSRFNA